MNRLIKQGSLLVVFLLVSFQVKGQGYPHADGKKIVDSNGREVGILVDKYQNAGHYSVQFNASNLPGGVYFYEI